MQLALCANLLDIILSAAAAQALAHAKVGGGRRIYRWSSQPAFGVAHFTWEGPMAKDFNDLLAAMSPERRADIALRVEKIHVSLLYRLRKALQFRRTTSPEHEPGRD